ncbi:hypothetical protein GCM10023165_30340 [Variovorax defluvii]|uniref:Uncharacterized protein n=1 Tax=Variovorax defluvii TaxID=913761 RepID=A0ABP8HW95_9BURK
MSFAHLILERQSDSVNLATYLVMSIDFNPEREWKPIGKLKLHKSEKTFTFEPLNEWVTEGITVSPQDPSTEEEMRGSGEYWMAWRGRIRAWALRMIEQEHFPEAYPS